MLDSVIKLTEKVAELLEYRSERKIRWFDKIVEPMYDGLKIIHQDYINFFETAKIDLQFGKPLTEIASEFKTRRLQEETERQAILGQAQIFAQEAVLADFCLFFDSVIDYFNGTPLSSGNTPSTLLARAIESVSFEECIKESSSSRTYDNRKFLEIAIQTSLDQLRWNWGQISAKFAKCKASSTD